MMFQSAAMKEPEKLTSTRQKLWLGILSRQSIRDGFLMEAIAQWSVTGAAFSPEAVSQGISETDAYDSTIAEKLGEGVYGEPLAYSEIIEDVQYAADLLRPLYSRTNGMDGWVVMPVSPLSTNENRLLVVEYRQLDRLVNRPNALFCLPATPDRLPLIEELVYEGVKPIISNVYSERQYIAVANAFLAGIERCLEADLEPVQTLFTIINIARLESTLQERNDAEQAIALTTGMAHKIHQARDELGSSEEWRRICGSGVCPPHIVWSYVGECGKKRIDWSLYGKLIAADSVLALPRDLIVHYDAQLNTGTSNSLDCATDDHVFANSSQPSLDLDYEADKIQQEHIGWLSQEWAMLLENLARKSAGVLPMKSLY